MCPKHGLHVQTRPHGVDWQQWALGDDGDLLPSVLQTGHMRTKASGGKCDGLLGARLLCVRRIGLACRKRSISPLLSSPLSSSLLPEGRSVPRLDQFSVRSDSLAQDQFEEELESELKE